MPCKTVGFAGQRARALTRLFYVLSSQYLFLERSMTRKFSVQVKERATLYKTSSHRQVVCYSRTSVLMHMACRSCQTECTVNPNPNATEQISLVN